MLIGGWQKFSLIDYPEKISLIIFTQGCSFRCHFCHNPSLVLPSLFQKPIEEKVKRHEECQLCGHYNPAGYAICTQCNSPLDPKKVIQMIRKRNETDTLLKQMKAVEPIIREIMKNGKLPTNLNTHRNQQESPSLTPKGGSFDHNKELLTSSSNEYQINNK